MQMEILTITAGTLDVNNLDNNDIEVGGDWDNNATFEERVGTVTFDGASAQTISHSAADFSTLVVTNSGGDVNFDEAWTAVNFTNATAGSSNVVPKYNDVYYLAEH